LARSGWAVFGFHQAWGSPTRRPHLNCIRVVGRINPFSQAPVAVVRAQQPASHGKAAPHHHFWRFAPLQLVPRQTVSNNAQAATLKTKKKRGKQYSRK
jgi:hypothetical protein